MCGVVVSSVLLTAVVVSVSFVYTSGINLCYFGSLSVAVRGIAIKLMAVNASVQWQRYVPYVTFGKKKIHKLSVAVHGKNDWGALRGSMVTGEAQRFQRDSKNILFG